MAKKLNSFSGNVPTWLALADLKIDYYTQFIKAWIPFNAWYMISYFDEGLKRTSDRTIIDFIKDNSNPYRDRIINLLQGEDNISQQFKYYVSQLHREIEGHTIPNLEDRLTFSSINITRNPVTQYTNTFRQLSYKVTYNITAPKGTKRIKCEILDNKKGLNCIYWEELYDWSIDDFLQSPGYLKLAPERKEQLRLCFEEVNPFKPVDIVIKPVRDKKGAYQKPNRCTVIDSAANLYFIDDVKIISKVIIEMLYRLRCALFHGELNPTETNQVIYEHAYQIQKVLIQELK